MLKVSEGLRPDVLLWDPSSLQRLMKNDDLSILKLGSAHIFALESRAERQWWSVTKSLYFTNVLNTFFKYLYFTGVVLFLVTFTLLHSKA